MSKDCIFFVVEEGENSFLRIFFIFCRVSLPDDAEHIVFMRELIEMG